MKRIVSILLSAILAIVTLSHCGGSSSGGSGAATSSTESSTGGGSTESVVGGNVSELTIDEDGTAVASFDDLSDDDEVVVAIYSYNTSNTAEAFQVSDESVPFLVTADVTEEIDSGDEESSEWDEIDITEEFHNMLREDEVALDEAEEFVYSGEAEDGGAAPASLVRFATTGSSRTFKVLSSFSDSSSYTTVTATLRTQTDDFEIWVDERDASTVTDAELATLADNFASAIPYENTLFGTESDVNDDDKFAVLFTRVVNGLGASSGGIVTGFFYATDLFETSQYANSNEMEILYALVPDPNADYSASAISKSFFLSNLAPGVMLHEYQHMISFNQHYFINGGSAEESWLNEGLSHLAEDLQSVNASSYMTATGIENPARVSGYLNNISTVCFSCGSSLNQRGGTYLFMRYLYEQAQQGNLSGASSGASFIQSLLNTSNRGVTNVVKSALGTSAANSQFKDLIGNFSVAVYLSNTDTNAASTVNFSGINLRATQDDNRSTTLNGPAVRTITGLPFTGTIQGSGIHYIQLSGSVINDNGGELSLSFSTDASFGAYVITQ